MSWSAFEGAQPAESLVERWKRTAEQLRSVVNLYQYLVAAVVGTCWQQFLPLLLCLRQMLGYFSGASLAQVAFPTGSSRRLAIRSALVLLAVLPYASATSIHF